MKPCIEKNILIAGAGGKPMLLDLFCPAGNGPAPVVIYAHGFNGFKDWGHFDLIAMQIAAAGFYFVKFNFSHNGTTPQEPESFADPEAYGANNYTKELHDLAVVIDWCAAGTNPYHAVINATNLYLIGHSRGGGIVLLKAAEDSRIKAVATWASVAECKTPWGRWSPERIAQWRETGVDYYTNSRTGQRLPLYYQLHQDYEANRERLNVSAAVERLAIPLLICHGRQDEAVPADAAYRLQAAAANAELFLVDSDHVFGRKHPWAESHLPQAMQEVVDRTVAFFKRVG